VKTSITQHEQFLQNWCNGRALPPMISTTNPTCFWQESSPTQEDTVNTYTKYGGELHRPSATEIKVKKMYLRQGIQH